MASAAQAEYRVLESKVRPTYLFSQLHLDHCQYVLLQADDKMHRQFFCMYLLRVVEKKTNLSFEHKTSFSYIHCVPNK